VSRTDLLALSPREAQLRAIRSALIGISGPVLMAFLLDLKLGPATYAVFAALVVIEAQGVAYWVLKERQAERGLRRPEGLAAFRWLRLIDVAVLVGTLAVVVLAWESDQGFLTVLLWLFAALEYVSLFFVHLYYVQRPVVKRAGGQEWLRQSRLSRDLAAGDAPATPARAGKTGRRR